MSDKKNTLPLLSKLDRNWLSGTPQWNAKSTAKWQKTRIKGKWNFILVRGILMFGSLFALMLTILNYQHLKQGDFFAIPVQALLAGLFFGAIMWFVTEKSYLKQTTHTPPSGKQH